MLVLVCGCALLSYGLASGVRDEGKSATKNLSLQEKPLNVTTVRTFTEVQASSPIPRQRIAVPTRNLTPVIRMTKVFNEDYDSYFRKMFYLPYEAKRRPFKVVFLKQRKEPRFLLKDIEVPDHVALKQSPFNDEIDEDLEIT